VLATHLFVPSRRMGCTMIKRTTIQTVVLLGVVSLFAPQAMAEGKFQKLSGSQIRAKVAGMEITDDVHWADVFERNGTLRSFSMGRDRAGKWRVQNEELCLEQGQESGCFEVWLAGNKVELRPKGSGLPREGTLQKPAARR
jgi:hypothetical protein